MARGDRIGTLMYIVDVHECWSSSQGGSIRSGTTRFEELTISAKSAQEAADAALTIAKDTTDRALVVVSVRLDE